MILSLARGFKFDRLFLVPKLHLGTRISPKLRFPQPSPRRSRYHVHEHEPAYFVTSTRVDEWLRVEAQLPEHVRSQVQLGNEGTK